MKEPVILEAVRTPFGKRGGAYREIQPVRLLSGVLTGLVARAGLEPEKIEDVLTGVVTQVNEQGANIGRLAVLDAGFPVEVPSVTLNRMCGSSQQTVHFAAQAVAAGDMKYAIGAGLESMTRVEMGSDTSSFMKSDRAPVVGDHELVHQGISAELVADKWKLNRQQLDEYAIESHRRASTALNKKLNKELLPTQGIDGQGQALTLEHDEGIRATPNREKIASLPTVFRPGDGVVTAANASQISDGAAAVLVADREVAVADGHTPRARFRARVVVGDDPRLQLTGVIPATKKALEKAGLTMNDIDWVEINEAFASVVLAWGQELNPDWNRVNPWGGAIAHGHPLGATGAGLMSKMLAGLEATGGQFGLQTMCIGHGMATATIIERIG